MYTDRRTFTWSSHEQFARISGDCNPIHMDAVAARRTHAGAPIVHGIHSLVWALDCWARSELYEPEARMLKVQFSRPIYVGEEITLEVMPQPNRASRARLMAGEEEVVTLSLDFGDLPAGEPEFARPHLAQIAPPAIPYDLSLEEMRNFRGTLSLGPLSSDLAEQFPHAASAFGLERLSELIGTSRLVGMIIPGLHSMYSGLAVSLRGDYVAPPGVLSFRVSSVVERFRAVRISILGRAVRGTLDTVHRLPPVRQMSMESVRSHVGANEFCGAKALVIGGSRGIGELTAKLLAAGGADVAITYAQGLLDATTVAREISATGAVCTAVNYDVRKSAREQLAALEVAPTHLYYFATPPIFKRKNALFDLNRLTDFNAYYLGGLFDVARACLELRPRGVRLFYPSSTAIDARSASMTEYTMSKAAGEILCADLARFLPALQILTRRLPSLPTDQTSSVVKIKTPDPVEVMLPIIRELHGVRPL
jgi:hypothetical protein